MHLQDRGGAGDGMAYVWECFFYMYGAVEKTGGSSQCDVPYSGTYLGDQHRKLIY